ncbi:hypothetical protein CDLVIII_2513 [Clostridium sp. DL-VIII]|uniref:flavodoxin n=1 Tax=Clostridium sp. DL-VIII TaxID=641107 RepID=UPI00023B0028|nr:flavodoxin [Clostridium sp. DL-VIII]EHI99144.1 hypothetical protein CDLVIII_2513 [Clostridium sp. DL-VIII]
MKTLVTYFSWSGNTTKIAQDIAKRTNGDLYRIERITPYSKDYNTCAYVEAKDEYDNHKRPAIKTPLPNINEYDAVIVAFPIWWYTSPMTVSTFFESFQDWKGKKVYIFANSYSDIPSQFTNSLNDAKRSANNANIIPGLYNKDIKNLQSWLKKNEF